VLKCLISNKHEFHLLEIRTSSSLITPCSMPHKQLYVYSTFVRGREGGRLCRL